MHSAFSCALRQYCSTQQGRSAHLTQVVQCASTAPLNRAGLPTAHKWFSVPVPLPSTGQVCPPHTSGSVCQYRSLQQGRSAHRTQALQWFMTEVINLMILYESETNMLQVSLITINIISCDEALSVLQGTLTSMETIEAPLHHC